MLDRLFPAPLVNVSCAILVGALVVACDSGSSTTSPPQEPSPKSDGESGAETNRWTGNIEISTHRVVFDYGSDTTLENAYCTTDDAGRDRLVVDSTLLPARDTFALRFEGDSMILAKESSPGETMTGRKLARTSGTIGQVEGSWKHSQYVYLPTVGRSYPDSFANTTMWFEEYRLVVGGGRFTETYTATVDWATAYVRDWKEYGMGKHGGVEVVTAVRENDSVVRLTGLETREVVRLRRLNRVPFRIHAGDLHVSSSDPTHAPGIQYHRPTRCPNGPTWYDGFIIENMMAAEGSAARGIGMAPAAPPTVANFVRGRRIPAIP